MKRQETYGGWMIVLEPGDQAASVRQGLEGLSLGGTNVTVEIQGDTAPGAVAEALRLIPQAGGQIGRVRAPRVTMPSPLRASGHAPAAVPSAAAAAPATAAPVSLGGIPLGFPEAATQPPSAPQPPLPPVTAAQPSVTQPPVAQSPATQSPATQSLAAPPPAGQTVVLSHSLRSGFRQEFPGSVVILGDVNPGVELIAAGDIIVMGALRGVAHAGAYGNTSAIVWARPIASAQIRIADALARSPEASSMSTMRRLEGPAEAELARIKDGFIMISPAGAAAFPLSGS